jgi:hypothetical protein
MPGLSSEEFDQTLQEPMYRVPLDEGPPFDFWPYVGGIPAGDFEGHDCSDGRVEYVYRHPAGRLEHVLINSENQNVFMAIIVGRQTKTVLGHRLLEFRRIYSIHDDRSPEPHDR